MRRLFFVASAGQDPRPILVASSLADQERGRSADNSRCRPAADCSPV